MLKRKSLLAMFAALACLGAGAMAGPLVGDPAIEITSTDVWGNQHSLSDFQGKTVILNFWTSW